MSIIISYNSSLIINHKQIDKNVCLNWFCVTIMLDGGTWGEEGGGVNIIRDVFVSLYIMVMLIHM